MAEAFIGLSVLVVLRDTPSIKVRGLVTNVVAGQLTLMTWLSSGLRTETLLVPGANVLEIEIESDLIPPTIEAKPEQPFVDPAIVSYSKPEEPSSRLTPDSQVNDQQTLEPDTAPLRQPPSIQLPPMSSHPKIPDIAIPAPTHAVAKVLDEAQRHSSPTAPENTAASATLSGPFNDLSLNGNPLQMPSLASHSVNVHMHRQSPEPKGEPPAPTSKSTRKRTKKAGPREGMISTPTQTPTELDIVSTRVSTQKKRSNNKKGWRQTPLLEEPTMANIRLPRAHHGLVPPDPALTPGIASHAKPTPEPTKGRRRRYKEEDDRNGWATGEATDIQDMGDFDFEENLSRFDKSKVFDQIRKDDTTADEARLVSFNRLPSARPGTAGGKNLHYTENVLDSPIKKSVGHSSGDSDIEISEARISSGRSLSRASTRRNIPSRKGSALATTSFDRVESPKIKTDSSTSYRKSSVNQPKPSLRILPSNRSCPCVTPLQMLELEQLATTELDITEDMMTENAARSIAETAYGLTPEGDRQESTSVLIVILAGNNKTGSRAIAAARHLRNHGTRVILCILGLEREDDLLDSVRRQLKIFRNCGGQAIKQDALMRTLRKLQSPVDLIIDALLGIHISFDDLRTDDQAAYFQLVCWANSSDADTLALDVLSGIDASSGVATSHDSAPLVIHAHHVFSLGAPKTGLLAYLADVDKDARPNLLVADIGISQAAWKKFGTRRRHGVEFGGGWVVGLVFQDGGV